MLEDAKMKGVAEKFLHSHFVENVPELKNAVGARQNQPETTGEPPQVNKTGQTAKGRLSTRIFALVPEPDHR